MIRIDLRIGLRYEIDAGGADFVFNIHAAQTPRQTLSAETLHLDPPLATTLHTDAVTGNRRLRLRAPAGALRLAYAVVVELDHYRTDPAQLTEVAVQDLPPQVLGYLYPSRYCQSDRLSRLAADEFGTLPRGHARVQAIADWVHRRVIFTPNSSNASTSALDTLVARAGVCRDFAHLMIALCRAVGVPARFVTGTDCGAEPALGPSDFHAYVEAYLGHRWVIFDPAGTGIPMGYLRIGTGRDAADVAFATVFGGVVTHAPKVSATALADAAHGVALPYLCSEALSTDEALDTMVGASTSVTRSNANL
jgi:transglutaminase-like putative cysteine protease